MKAAAAVLGASLLFFVGVLTGAGRREAVPPPTAIPLGVTNQPAGSGADRPSSSGTPDSGTKRTTTTTARTGATAPPAGTTPTSTATTASSATTATTTASSTTSTTGQVQQVDNQVDCSSSGKRGKGTREPCPSSTTSSTGGAPGGGRNG